MLSSVPTPSAQVKSNHIVVGICTYLFHIPCNVSQYECTKKYLAVVGQLLCTFLYISWCKCAKVPLEYVPRNRITGFWVMFKFTRQKQVVFQFILLPAIFKISFQPILSLTVSKLLNICQTNECKMVFNFDDTLLLFDNFLSVFFH